MHPSILFLMLAASFPTTRKARKLTKQAKMLPELPNEVWMAVLENLEEVRDLGRLQQVSHSFNAIIADVGWTKVKGLESYWMMGGPLLIVQMENWDKEDEQEQFRLPIEKRLLLVKELAKKARNITNISLDVASLAPPMNHEEFQRFHGEALNMLKSGSQKISDFHFIGNLALLTSALPNLASFISAKSQTIQHIHIEDWTSNELRPQVQILPELLETLRGCSQLKSTHLRSDDSPFNIPLFASILHGKTKLKSLDLYMDVPSVEPHVSAILDSGIQFLYFGCNPVLLNEYAAEMDRRGLMAMDDHPLLDVKELRTRSERFPHLTFSLLPNLETMQIKRGEYEEVFRAVSGFLSKYEHSPGSRKILRLEMNWGPFFCTFSGVRSGEELATRVQAKFPCQSTMQALGARGSELSFSRGNATVICHLQDLSLAACQQQRMNDRSVDEMDF